MDFLSYDANPWNDKEERQYGNTRRLLSLANDMGYKFDRPADTEQQKRVYESYDSVKMLGLMSDISEAEEKLNSINREINRIIMDKETHDITSLNKIKSRLTKLASLSTHLGETVDNKSVITSRLQQPYSGENLLIDASLHKHVVEFFSMVSPILSDLSTLLHTISWTSEKSQDFNKQTDQVLVKVNKTLDSIYQQVEKITKLRSTIGSMSSS